MASEDTGVGAETVLDGKKGVDRDHSLTKTKKSMLLMRKLRAYRVSLGTWRTCVACVTHTCVR